VPLEVYAHATLDLLETLAAVVPLVIMDPIAQVWTVLSDWVEKYFSRGVISQTCSSLWMWCGSNVDKLQ